MKIIDQQECISGYTYFIVKSEDGNEIPAHWEEDYYLLKVPTGGVSNDLFSDGYWQYYVEMRCSSIKSLKLALLQAINQMKIQIEFFERNLLKMH